MESAVSETELNTLLKDPNYTILLNKQFLQPFRLDEPFLEVLGCDSKRLLIGTVVQDHGLVLATNDNKCLLQIVFTDEPEVTLGKMYRPNRTLHYSVEFEDKEGNYGHWNILRNDDQFIKVETRALKKIMPCLSMVFKCCLCMKGDCELSYHTLDGRKQIGRTAPGICREGDNMILYFKPDTGNEERLALLGTSVLFVLEVLYPQYAKCIRSREAS